MEGSLGVPAIPIVEVWKAVESRIEGIEQQVFQEARRLEDLATCLRLEMADCRRLLGMAMAASPPPTLSQMLESQDSEPESHLNVRTRTSPMGLGVVTSSFSGWETPSGKTPSPRVAIECSSTTATSTGAKSFSSDVGSECLHRVVSASSNSSAPKFGLRTCNHKLSAKLDLASITQGLDVDEARERLAWRTEGTPSKADSSSALGSALIEASRDSVFGQRLPNGSYVSPRSQDSLLTQALTPFEGELRKGGPPLVRHAS